MNDIKEMGNKATECAKECIDRLKNVDWKARGEQAKAKAKEFASKENIDKVKAGIKSGVADLKTAEGRDRLKASAITGATTAKNKIIATWNSGPKGKAICVGAVAVIVGLFIIGRGDKEADELAAVEEVDRIINEYEDSDADDGVVLEESVAVPQRATRTKVWQCEKCCDLEESDYQPTGGRCEDNSPHRWKMLGESGDTVWQCRKCGMSVETKSMPNGGRCPEEVNAPHGWSRQ